jgi:hypothetical protein
MAALCLGITRFGLMIPLNRLLGFNPALKHKKREFNAKHLFPFLQHAASTNKQTVCFENHIPTITCILLGLQQQNMTLISGSLRKIDN